MKCSICEKEITEYGCPDCNPIGYANKVAEEIQSQNLSEEELEELDYGCICCGLDKALAESMKRNHLGSVIIPDEGNPGDFTLMGIHEGVKSNNTITVLTDDDIKEVEGAEFD